MTVFHYQKRQYEMAQSYNELTGKQLIAIAAILTKGLPDDVARLQALRVLLNKNRIAFGMLSADLKERLLQYVEFLFDKNTLTAQLIPEYKKMYGPAEGFDNLTMAEWNACEIYYNQMLNTEESDDALNKLIAVLYRVKKNGYNTKRNKDGDARVSFNVNEINYYKQKVAKWPAKVKQAILLWFDGCRQDIKERYELFDEPEGGDEQDPGMFEIIRELCGTRWGTFQQVEQLNVHIVLRELCIMKEQAEKLPG